jgi:hypothetical protein
VSNVASDCIISRQPFSSLCYTGGDDCIVRLWKTDEGEDQEPPTAIEAGESITTLAASVRPPFSFLVSH